MAIKNFKKYQETPVRPNNSLPTYYHQRQALPSPISPCYQQPEHYAHPQPERYAHPQPKRYAHPQPEGYAHPQPERCTPPQPEGYAYPQPEGYAHPQPECYTHPQPEGYAHPQPERYAHPQPESMEHYPPPPLPEHHSSPPTVPVETLLEHPPPLPPAKKLSLEHNTLPPPQPVESSAYLLPPISPRCYSPYHTPSLSSSNDDESLSESFHSRSPLKHSNKARNPGGEKSIEKIYPITEVFNRTFLEARRKESVSRANFATILVRNFFTREVRISSNIAGQKKNQFNTEMIAAIKVATFKMYPLTSAENEKVAWKECTRAIDSANRQLYRPKAKEN